MLLSELEWKKLLTNVDHAEFPRDHDRINDGSVYRFDTGLYSIVDRRVTPRREWRLVDELTAECILIELTKAPAP